MGAAESPDWVRDAAIRSIDEVRTFTVNGALFIARPGWFAREWIEGRLRALNPLAVLATGAGVLGVARALLDLILGRGPAAQGLLESVRDAVAPFAHYAMLGLFCHLLLRPRRRLRDSLGVALFAGGGPGVASALLVYAAGIALWYWAGRPPVIHAGLLGSLPPLQARLLLWIAYSGYALFLACLSLGLRALHRVPLWRAVLATVVAVLFAGALFGLRPADVAFGTRVLLRLHPLHATIWVD